MKSKQEYQNILIYYISKAYLINDKIERTKKIIKEIEKQETEK